MYNIFNNCIIMHFEKSYFLTQPGDLLKHTKWALHTMDDEISLVFEVLTPFHKFWQQEFKKQMCILNTLSSIANNKIHSGKLHAGCPTRLLIQYCGWYVNSNCRNRHTDLMNIWLKIRILSD